MRHNLHVYNTNVHEVSHLKDASHIVATLSKDKVRRRRPSVDSEAASTMARNAMLAITAII
jgi:hypothetical protein